MTTVAETAIRDATGLRARPLPRIDAGTLGIRVLAGGLVLYLGLNGGGYGVVVHSQVGIVVWWIVLIGAAWGLLPAARLSRVGWGTFALFGAFVAWTALGLSWSISSERSLADLSLVAGYLGVLVLGLALHADRARALRQTTPALAAAIVVVGILALVSRLHPGLFAAASQTGSFLPGTARRLAWPLDYWNALAALLAFGLPLLLVLATSARTLYAQAAAAAGIPVVVLAGYLTFSRGGAIAGAVAVVVFLALAPERLPKVVTTLAAGAGSALLISAASHRAALEQGLLSAAARHQGASLVLPILLVCAGVALAQVGIGLAARRMRPGLLSISPRRAGLLLGGALCALVVLALLAGAPTKLSHAWRDFKALPPTSLKHASIDRFSNLSSNGRYQLWKGAVDATRGHTLAGSGPGTFQLLWLPRAPRSVSYVQNAHSLYFETLAELGVVGLALLVAFLVAVVVAAIRAVVQSRYAARTRAAGAAAALVTFAVSAASDWIWQVPVLPVAFLLIAGAVLAPATPGGRGGVRFRVGIRAGAAALALACLIAIAIPLATANAVSASQAAASSGDSAVALRDARAAAQIEPAAASPQVQLALVQEFRGDIPAALAAARRAARDEPDNWSTWLILSRLEAEAGRPRAAIKALRRARALNPTSPLFAELPRTSAGGTSGSAARRRGRCSKCSSR
ncbi:MAG TPA: O-antigen ligase family protein [Solirubrobacteraceae bacterium]|nr:O-antigen ligase family protein [Solirubrobacteraceae bacterium]